jgi:hypothetical protein
MNQSPSKVASYTGTLSVLAQVMTGLGFITMIIGGVVLALDLIGEFSASMDEKEGFAVAILSGSILLNGLLVAGLGQALMAIRSIAINCAVIAEK